MLGDQAGRPAGGPARGRAVVLDATDWPQAEAEALQPILHETGDERYLDQVAPYGHRGHVRADGHEMPMVIEALSGQPFHEVFVQAERQSLRRLRELNESHRAHPGPRGAGLRPATRRCRPRAGLLDTDRNSVQNGDYASGHIRQQGGRHLLPDRGQRPDAPATQLPGPRARPSGLRRAPRQRLPGPASRVVRRSADPSCRRAPAADRRSSRTCR